MKRLLHASLLTVVLFCSTRVTTAQNLGSSIQSGFAVITPLDGEGTGLSVSEVFGQEVGGTLFRSSVLPSPLVTLTSIVIVSDPSAAVDTGIAIVNPNAAAVTVDLRLNNQNGLTIANRTIVVGGRQQISVFVTELFSGVPDLLRPFSGLLFIGADLPVGVLGLAFEGPSFASLPVASQLGGVNVATTNVTSNVGVITSPQPTFTLSGTPAGAIPSVQPIPSVMTLPPVPTTINQIPSTFPNLPPTQPVNGVTVPLATTTATSAVGITSGGSFVLVRRDIFFEIPPLAVGVGGLGAQLLPQVATGGGWVTAIAIANTSTESRTVRVDFFNSEGGPLVLPFGSSVPSLVVPAGGVVTVSTN
jgi:hypothetical protein